MDDIRSEAHGGGSREIRCPSCSRLLVLRSGPAITPHFAHRPRQSCRTRSGRSPVSPLRLEQLTLFDPAGLDPPLLSIRLEPMLDDEPVWAPMPVPHRRRSRRRRRRRAWLPRLIRWITAQSPR